MSTEYFKRLTKEVADKISEHRYIAAPYLIGPIACSIRVLLPDGDFHTVRFTPPMGDYAEESVDKVVKAILEELRAHEQKRNRRRMGESQS